MFLLVWLMLGGAGLPWNATLHPQHIPGMTGLDGLEHQSIDGASSDRRPMVDVPDDHRTSHDQTAHDHFHEMMAAGPHDVTPRQPSPARRLWLFSEVSLGGQLSQLDRPPRGWT